jgi:hypothetical protein
MRIGALVGFLQLDREPPPPRPVGLGMHRLRTPSPALVIACIALFVALSGAAYAAATLGAEDIVNGSIRNRDFKDGTLRGNEAKRDGFGGGAIKERSLNPAEFDESKLGKVNSAATAGRRGAQPRDHVRREDRRRPVPGGLRHRRAQLHLLRHAGRPGGGRASGWRDRRRVGGG